MADNKRQRTEIKISTAVKKSGAIAAALALLALTGCTKELPVEHSKSAGGGSSSPQTQGYALSKLSSQEKN